MSTYVLIHGAWHGGWCWRDVEKLLEQAGHRVLTPTLIGLAERADLMSKDLTLDILIDDVAQFFEREDVQDAIVVGHSFGGSMTSGVAERVPERISQLVYLDAAVLTNGESMFDCQAPELVEERLKAAEDSSGGISLPTPSCEKLGILDADQCKYVLPKLTPHPIGTYISPITLEHAPGEGFPCTYIPCVDPDYTPLHWSRDRARAYGWPIIPISTGHDAMISAPQELTRILLEIEVT